MFDEFLSQPFPERFVIIGGVALVVAVLLSVWLYFITKEPRSHPASRGDDGFELMLGVYAINAWLFAAFMATGLGVWYVFQ